MSEILLSIKNLNAGYGRLQVLCDVSLEIHKGEAVTVLGANGAGKSTLLKAISGFVSVSSGTIEFGGESLLSLPPHSRAQQGIAHVPEGRRIFSKMTVRENITLGAYLRTNRAEIHHDEERIYELFPVLKERRTQLGGTLSGGEQQMLAIGRALMSRPTLLLLDEPSMGVAPLLCAKISETLRTLVCEGVTILLVEQNARAALSLAERGYVFETGKVVLCDTTNQLANNPKIREAYLG